MATSNPKPGLQQKTTATRERIVFALLAASAGALLTLALLSHLHDSAPPDMMTFYTSGTMLRRGLQSKVYDETSQITYQRQLFGPSVPTEVNPHPPFETLIFVPLTYLPFPTAYVLWGLLNLILLGWSLYLLKPFATHFDTESRVTLALAGLCPLISTLREGQDQILLVLVCVGAFICLKKRREFEAGAVLGAGLFRFQFVLPLLVIFVALRKWKIAVGTACVGAMLGLTSLVVFGWGGVRQYISLVESFARSAAMLRLVPAMPNVRGFVYILMAGRAEPRYMAALVAAGSLVLLAWPIIEWRRRPWDPGNRTFDLLFALSVVVSVMISYHLLVNGMLLLIVPALLLLNYTAGAYARGPRRWSSMLPLICLFLMTILLNLAAGNRLSFLFLPILWLAFVISGEISHAREQAGGGARGHF
jgi:hypothetical protein